MLQQALKEKLITQSDLEKINNGLDIGSFRDYHSVKDKDIIRKLLAYETLFKLLPILSPKWKVKLKPNFFMKLPGLLCSFLGFMVDVIFGLKSKNPSHISYAKYYLYHLKKSFLHGLRIKAKPATAPHEDQEYKLEFHDSINT